MTLRKKGYFCSCVWETFVINSMPSSTTLIFFLILEFMLLFQNFRISTGWQPVDSYTLASEWRREQNYKVHGSVSMLPRGRLKQPLTDDELSSYARNQSRDKQGEKEILHQANIKMRRFHMEVDSSNFNNKPPKIGSLHVLYTWGLF